MEEHLVSFETAKLAKEKGLDWVCRYASTSSDKEPIELITPSNYNGGVFKNMYSHPTQSLLQKWLRDVHKIYIQPYISGRIEDSERVYFECDVVCDFVNEIINDIEFETYEEALEEGLKTALNCLKN